MKGLCKEIHLLKLFEKILEEEEAGSYLSGPSLSCLVATWLHHKMAIGIHFDEFIFHI